MRTAVSALSVHSSAAISGSVLMTSSSSAVACETLASPIRLSVPCESFSYSSGTLLLDVNQPRRGSRLPAMSFCDLRVSVVFGRT